MSRLYRSMQTLLGSARIASRLPGSQTVRIERVKVKKARSMTGFLGTVIKGALGFQLLMWAIPPARAPANDDDDYEEEEPWFIPFPLTTVQHPPEPYTLDDPEWREFVRISRDKAFQKQMRDHMANLVLKAASKNPIFTQRFGHDVRIRRYWMDLDYPYKAPPVYERSGILITDEAWEWATMPCDPWTAKILSHVLWPRPVALGFWAFGTAIVKDQAVQVGRHFGYGSEDPESAHLRVNPGTPSPLPSSHNPEVQKALERIRQGTTRRPEEVNDPGSMSASAGASPPVPSTPHDKALGVSEDQAVGRSQQETPEQKRRAEELKKRTEEFKLSLSRTVSEPWKRFTETYTRERNNLRPDPARGSVFLSGLVELETPKAWVVVDVLGWYNPKTQTHDPGAVRMTFRRVQFKVQTPVRR